MKKKEIHKESFISKKEEKNKKIKKKIIIVIYKKKKYKLIAKSKKSILKIILENNINIPFSCKNGSCKSCIAKCLSGKVKEDKNGYMKKKSEYILTCISYVKKNNTIIKIE